MKLKNRWIFGSVFLFGLTLLRGAQNLPPNEWVPIPDDGTFKQLVEHRSILSSSPRERGSDWLFVEKWPVNSASAQGVWHPDRKIALFLANNPYSSTKCRLVYYDPASTEKVKKIEWGKASGWNDLIGEGDKLNGTIIWASLCYDPENDELVLCGGNSSDNSGSPGSMIYSFKDNRWQRLDFSDAPHARFNRQSDDIRRSIQALEGRLRARWHLSETTAESGADLAGEALRLRDNVSKLAQELSKSTVDKKLVEWATPQWQIAATALSEIGKEANPAAIAKASHAAEAIRVASDILAPEPPPRANSAMAYDPVARQIVLFGGDHLDYLLSDTWHYDCRTRRWHQMRPAIAPAPRGGHAMLRLPASGKIILIGGYNYNDDVWPGSLYLPRATFEIWSYDVANSKWQLHAAFPLPKDKKGQVQQSDALPKQPFNSGLQAVVSDDDVLLCGEFVCRVDTTIVKPATDYGAPANTVTYRQGQYLPTWHDDIPQPVAATQEEFLKQLPPNTWVAVKPPKVFRDHRDWGTATFDSDRAQILWFSGGHCCYSGTDVSIYSTRGGTWRMSTYPEMPINYITGTGYHSQRWSFGERPFMTSHTYKLYAYDPRLRKMLLFNRGETYVFDPSIGDWERPTIATPFGGGVWVPKFCTTPDGVLVWAPPVKGPKNGLLWRFDNKAMAWNEFKTSGGPLPPTPNDDYGTIVYETKRKAALMYTSWGKNPGQLWRCDMATGALEQLTPGNQNLGPAYPRESIYLPNADIVLFADVNNKATTLYDVAANRFRKVLFEKETADKSNPGWGLMYDANRDLIWRVSPYWDLMVMRFDHKTANFAAE